MFIQKEDLELALFRDKNETPLDEMNSARTE